MIDIDKRHLSSDCYRVVRGLTFLDDSIRQVGNVELPTLSTLLQEAADMIRSLSAARDYWYDVAARSLGMNNTTEMEIK